MSDEERDFPQIPKVPEVLIADDPQNFSEEIGFEHFRFKSPGWFLMIPSEFKDLIGPGVYIFWGKEDKPLYIGSSSNVMSRASDPNHASARKALGECDSVELIPMPSVFVALHYERALIRTLKPRYNKTWVDRASEQV